MFYQPQCASNTRFVGGRGSGRADDLGQHTARPEPRPPFFTIKHDCTRGGGT